MVLDGCCRLLGMNLAGLTETGRGWLKLVASRCNRRDDLRPEWGSLATSVKTAGLEAALTTCVYDLLRCS